jgi:replicative DNA helicase
LAGGKLPEEITEELFTVKKHRIIFRAILRLNQLGAIQKWHDNLSLLITFLSEMGSLDAVGGREYLTMIEGTSGYTSLIGGITLELLQLAVKREAAT